MSEIKNVYDQLLNYHNKGLDAAIATVVAVKGSAYRRPGARMVISEEGDIFGMIGGGCFDANVKEIALQVLRTKQPELRLYDLSDDSVWGLGLGCNGSVYVLIEAISTDQGQQWMQQIAFHLTKQDCLLIEHHLDHPLDFKIKPGIVTFSRSFQQGNLGQTNKLVRQFDSSVFQEVLKPAPRLVIFGAGHDVIPLVDLADQAGFQVCIVDQREHLLNDNRFKRAVEFICAKAEDFSEKITAKSGDYVIFMSHKIEYDAAAFHFYHNKAVSYFGFLGPKKRSQQIMFDILNLNPAIIDPMIKKIHSPIGINIGSETAEQVAISIVSELLAVKNNSNPQFLRDKLGRIHEENNNHLLNFATNM
ncbi:XdhC family protein [Bacillus canaveralius]|uniref:XdhC family protein n=1 Tax=Bacillus canaveralius TaxID=1403243 RepID=UPI000F79708B|nr:XdhC family protein [Bacillus canaveralius]RSK55137.1 XdhC family protein [Bacillus canaveralius]